jgi:hypothetical protein
MNDWIHEARNLASMYHWPEFPQLDSQLAAGEVPPGFPRLVGQTIALFMQAPTDPEHGKRLARLRTLLALITRRTPTQETP